MLEVIQVVRDVGTTGGVSGVAYHLEREWQRLGIQTGRITAKDVPLAATRSEDAASLFVRKSRLLTSVIAFSLWGGFLACRRSREEGVVTISHNDALGGDVYICHSVHKLYLQQRGSLLMACLRNPLHLFVLLREDLRYRAGMHKVIVALSEGDRRALETMYRVPPEKIRLVPNGVDLQRFAPDASVRTTMRAELGLPDGVFTFLFVGHEFTRKGLAIAIDALKILLEEGRRVRLVVAGSDDPSVVTRHVRGIEEHVTFLGARPDIENVFRACDAFVLPTLYESFALVVLEAMACGLPTVTTRVHGVEDYAVEGETGFMVKRDPQAFAEAMARIIDMPDRSRMAAACRDRAEAYAWPTIADRYLSVFRSAERT